MDYSNNGSLGSLIVNYLSPSVSSMRWLDRDLIWGQVFDWPGGPRLQITEFEGEFPPRFSTNPPGSYSAIVCNLPNHQTLCMRFGVSGTDQHEFQTTGVEIYPATFCKTFFDSISLPKLRTLLLDSFVISSSVFACLLRLVARHDITLNL